MVNLRPNQRYARVCFDPVGGSDTANVDFYHHTHEQVACDSEQPENTAIPADGETDANPS
jgi:hypothetical protein